MSSTRVPGFLDDISAFVKVPWDYDEHPLLMFRPAQAADSATAQAQTLLGLALEREVAAPLLESTTRDEFIQRFADCVGKYTETRTAFRALQRQSMVASTVDGARAYRRMQAQIEQLAGPEGFDHFEFAVDTIRRAFTLAKTIASRVLETHQLGLEFRQAFTVHTSIFACAQYVLLAASTRHELPSGVGVECSFEALRHSALNAHGAVRRQVDLIRPIETGDMSPLPFDEEDAWLADITS